MGLSSKLLIRRILLRGISLGLLFGGAAQAGAATTDALCGPSEGTGPSRYPSTGSLAEAARAVEATLSDAQAGDALTASLVALELPQTEAARPAGAALAEYCSAAGEVMRLSSQGSQYQAQTYLVSAFRGARAAGSAPVAARAAYRLGLVSLAGPAVAGARGTGRPSRGGTTAVATEAEEAQANQGQACSSLDNADLATRSNAFISTVALECASERALQTNDAPLSALASLRLARLGLSLAESPSSRSEEIRRLALEKATSAMPVAAKIPDRAVRAEMLGRLAQTALELGGGADPAVRAAVNAMREAADGNPAAGAFAAGVEARLSLTAGDSARAAAFAREAILLESQRALPARLPEWYLLLAEAEPFRRAQHVSAAYAALGNIRPLLPRNDPLTEESTFALYMRRVFESAVDVQLAGAGTANEAMRIAEAQQIVETYRQAELQSVFGNECLPPREPLMPQELARREILLYPILLPDRTELLYAVGGEAGYRRLPPNMAADRKMVARLVEQVVLSMSYGGDEGWREPARQLYDILIKPIEGELQPGSMLAIIPDGALRALPFAALPAADGSYLVQKTRLAVAPALAYSQPGLSEDGAQRAVVAASLQQEVTLPAGYFPRLEGTTEEARIAAANLSSGRVIEDFRKADLVQALATEQVDVLHLATHASFNGRSDRAFIVANGETIPLSELRSLIAQDRARGEELDLLVLSACETAVGDDEASMGLAGAAVQAGAMSAIASLWQVNDAGTAELMKQFYSRYGRGESRSEALRNAQLALLDEGGDNADPNIWAAFTLLGAWR